MNHEDFTDFYEKYSRRLWAYVARCAGNSSVADDVVQESFVRFLTAKLPPGMTDEYARNYLFKIATNCLRRSVRREPQPLPEQIEAQRHDADETLDLQMAMGRLRPSQRELLWLAYAERFSHREIAAMVGCQESSVRTLLHRAKTKIIEYLQPSSGDLY